MTMKRIPIFLACCALLPLAFSAPRPLGAHEDDGGPEYGKAELTLAGKRIAVVFGRPSTHGEGYQSMAAGVPDGFTWRMGRNKATRLDTEIDLEFGDVVIKAGSYSLVARRNGDHWQILFHPNYDRWGTPVPKDGYVGKVSLKATDVEGPVEFMTIKLESQGDGGRFTLLWGELKGFFDFTIAR